MPKLKIENISKAPQGVHNGGERVYILPEQEKTVTVTTADHEGLKAAVTGKLLRITVIDADAHPETADPSAPAEVVVADQPAPAAPSNDDVARLSDDGARAAEALSDPALTNAVVEEVVQPPGIDEMDEAALRQYITDRSDGQPPHPNCSLGTLRAKATALAGG
jgi:hypothetical protein